MAMGETIEEKFLGNFGYIALGLFIFLFLLLWFVLEIPSSMTAVGPWV